ncbi:MAG: hypothetical protein R2911_44110 [Caldilineaceae bacterium]
MEIKQCNHRHSVATFFALSVGLSWLLTWALLTLPPNPMILPLLTFALSAGVAWAVIFVMVGLGNGLSIL